jgi:hypothetical protein
MGGGEDNDGSLVVQGDNQEGCSFCRNQTDLKIISKENSISHDSAYNFSFPTLNPHCTV